MCARPFETRDHVSLASGLRDRRTGWSAGNVSSRQSKAGRPAKRTARGQARTKVAHELSHPVLDVPEEDERLCHRFVGAFLVPTDALRRELGQRRSTLTEEELRLLKLRYGVSMQPLVRRAAEAGVLSAARAKDLPVRFRGYGCHRRGPAPQPAPERPMARFGGADSTRSDGGAAVGGQGQGAVGPPTGGGRGQGWEAPPGSRHGRHAPTRVFRRASAPRVSSSRSCAGGRDGRFRTWLAERRPGPSLPLMSIDRNAESAFVSMLLPGVSYPASALS